MTKQSISREELITNLAKLIHANYSQYISGEKLPINILVPMINFERDFKARNVENEYPSKSDWVNWIYTILVEGTITDRKKRTHKSIFDDSDIVEIFNRKLIHKQTYTEIATYFGCNRKTIIDIIKRRTYQDVQVGYILRLAGMKEDDL